MSNSRKLAVAMDAVEATLETQIVSIAGREVAIRMIDGDMLFWVDGIPSVIEYVFSLAV